MMQEWKNGGTDRGGVGQLYRIISSQAILIFIFPGVGAAPAQTRVTSVSKPRNITSTAKPRALKLKNSTKAAAHIKGTKQIKY
jgi:hypothetical protein